MKKSMMLIAAMLALLSFPLLAFAQTRALLVACSDFVTQPDLGSAISGNLHMIGSALISADMPLGNLSIEDGTIGTVQALDAAVNDAFSMSSEDDLSILYLCTHGVISSSDDEQVYLLLGDGVTESPLSASGLYEIMAGIQGEKLLILDACYSGALIGRGVPEPIRLPGAREAEPAFFSPFLRDSSIHVLTSANGHESSWYYDSDHLETGAVSYFASALSSGLGLYGLPEADLNGDGSVTLSELHRHLSIAVPSSSSQLLSTNAEGMTLPVSGGAALSRPLTGFSYGSSLLLTDDPTLDFSFTVTQEGISIQYRLIDYDNGRWNWENAKVFEDIGDAEDAALTPGRKHRSLSLSDIASQDNGYLMLQVFSVSDSGVLLCSERLIAVQPTHSEETISISCPVLLEKPGIHEFPIDVHLAVPAELTISVYDSEGLLIRRLASSQMTRPSPESVTHLYWDGRDAAGSAVPDGRYTITAEAIVASRRQKAAADIAVGS